MWCGVVVFLTDNNTTPTKLFYIVLLVGLWQLTEDISMVLTDDEEKADSAKNEELEHLSEETSPVSTSAGSNVNVRLQTQ